MDGFIAGHLRGVSRTYALLIPMLPAGLADAVGVAYLLMRIVDTLEDATDIDDVGRRELLGRLDSALERLPQAQTIELPVFGDNEAERELMQCTPEVLARVSQLTPEYCADVQRCGRTMIRGVLEMLDRSERRGVAYPGVGDAGELRLYCYYVAGVVGEMLCGMMSHHLRQPALLRMRDLAVELGLGLQLVNILKDSLKDAEQGRRYLPLGESGSVSHAEVYKAVLQEARHSLRRGVEFVLSLPAAARELRSFCGLPIAWGAMTLARAEFDAARAKIGRDVIRSSIEYFSKVAGNDQALRGWFAKLLPAGDASPALSDSA